jgi:hypothetical protein
MAQHAATLGDDDIVLFLKDTRAIHQISSTVRSVEEMLEIVPTNGFACGLKPTNGFSSFHHTPTLSSFTKLNYKGQNFTSQASMAQFTTTLNITLEGLIPVCYGGVGSIHPQPDCPVGPTCKTS